MSDRRARARQQTSGEIVDSAERLVLDRDPATVTVAEIARGLGLTAGALYRYFPGREAILALVEARCLASLADAVAAAPRGPDPLADLAARAGAVVAWADREPRRYQLLARMLATPETLVEGEALADVVPAALRVIGPLHEALDRCVASGALRGGDPTGRTWATWAALHGALQLGKLQRFVPGLSARIVAREALEAQWLGWGAAPERVAALPPWEVP